jgi:hypothetical protein
MECDNKVQPESEQKKEYVPPWEQSWWQEADEVLMKRIDDYYSKFRIGKDFKFGRLPKPSMDTILKIDEDPIVKLLLASTTLSSSASDIIEKIEDTTGVDVRGPTPGLLIPLEWLGFSEEDHKDKMVLMFMRRLDLEYGVYPPICISRETITECKNRLKLFSPIRDYVDKLEVEELNDDNIQIIE